MEDFTYEARVAPETAKQDKIEIKLGYWFIHGLDVDLTHFLQRLGPPPADDGGLVPQQLQHYGTIFNRPDAPEWTNTTLEIRKGRGRARPADVPLYSGVLTARRQGAAEAGIIPERRLLSLNLSINPTRYVAHQRHPGRDPFIGPEHWGAPSLVARRVAPRVPGEMCLDGKDNVLLGPRTRAFGRPEVWHHHLRRYWDGIITELDQEFRRCAPVGPYCRPPELSPHISLRTTETYWEFRHPDPTALVADLGPVLLPLGIEASVREFPYPDGWSETSFTGNSRSLTILLATGVLLRVYAKTTRRIRFEIKHDLRKHAGVIGGSHTAENHHALFDWLETIAEDAARRLNDILAYVQGQQHRPAASLRPYNLLYRVIRAVPDERTAEAVLSLLVNNPVLHIGANDPLKDAVRSLTEWEVLERIPGKANPSRYVVKPLLRSAVDELRGNMRRKHRAAKAC